MKEERYIISDAAKKLAAKPHVLRYWEEELHIPIPRNDMGHRYYRESDISLFETIIKLKEHNYHLKEIKALMPDLERIAKLDDTALDELHFELQESHLNLPAPIVENTSEPIQTPNVKMEQFKQILGRIVSDALKSTSTDMAQNITTSVTENVSKEMDYMLRQKEEADEERYRSLDETIRAFQKARQEAAASEMLENNKRSHRRRPRKK